MQIVRLVDAPELEGPMWGLGAHWPQFMMHDKVSETYYGDLSRWLHNVQLAVSDDGSVVARSFRVDFAMGEEFGRPSLPDDGWDGVLLWAFFDRILRRPPTHTSAIEITIHPEHRGTGLAGRMIESMAVDAAAAGFDALYAPVRPSRKSEEPGSPMDEYVRRVRDDGLPFDPWLRTHVRLGAEIVGVCPTAMTISGTLQQWREWTGLPLERSGDVHVPGALVPVHVSVEHDHAVYVEPNVWMRHPLDPR
jgi:GNAT superfamily N-acetyltransferase